MGKGVPSGSHTECQVGGQLSEEVRSEIWCTARERIGSSSISSLR